MDFAHSIGQDFFKDLLHYTNDKTQTDQASIQTDYELQKRLSDFWKNNDKPTLLKSQKYSGEVLLNKTVPLGGPINFSDGCLTEFPYWSIGNKQSNPEQANIINDDGNDNDNNNDNDNEYINTKEHFTQNIANIKENFNGNTNIVVIVVILIILLLFVMFFVRKL